MATKKVTTTEKVFYTVIPESYPLNNDDEIGVFDTIESAFFDAKDHYDEDPDKEKFVVYEIKKKGIIDVKIDIKIS